MAHLFVIKSIVIVQITCIDIIQVCLRILTIVKLYKKLLNIKIMLYD